MNRNSGLKIQVVVIVAVSGSVAVPEVAAVMVVLVHRFYLSQFP